MYRSQTFKIIQPNLKKKEKAIIRYLIIVVVCILTIWILAITDAKVNFELIIILTLNVLLIYPFFIKGYDIIGSIKLSGEDVQIITDEVQKIQLSDISAFNISFKGYLGQFPTHSVLLGTQLFHMKKGIGNIISINTQNKNYEYEFLSRNSADIEYIRKYFSFLKEKGINAELIK